ncbi:MAG: hypothetical protein O2816_01630, partial [Planctomycetota bacterium]|nr:hypothetical protein [Planctomycetota bacterium]
RALSEDQVAPASRELAALAFADNEERRSYRRSKLRNQASARDSSGKPCGYGVFDGNPAACEFWSCGTLALGDGELIVVHSDGAQPLVAVAGFRAILREFCRTGDAVAAQLACGALDVPFDDDVSLAVLGPLVRPPAPGFSRTDRPGPPPPPA